MTITLTRGQLLESLFTEAPATEGALTLFLRQRYAFGAYIPEVKVEGDVIHFKFDEAVVGRTNADYQRIVRLAEKGKYDEAKKLIGDVIEKGTVHSEVVKFHGRSRLISEDFEMTYSQSTEAIVMPLDTTARTHGNTTIFKNSTFPAKE